MKADKDALSRNVASSTAVETGRSVKQEEQKLKTNEQKSRRQGETRQVEKLVGDDVQ